VAQILALSAGASSAWPCFGTSRSRHPGRRRDPQVSPAAALASFAVFALILGALPFLAAVAAKPDAGPASAFYRTGALVFGGGHVVLPLCRPRSSDGLDAAGSLPGRLRRGAGPFPGPLFSFAGLVGAAQDVAPGGWRGGLWR
jgi:chromate transporter